MSMPSIHRERRIGPCPLTNIAELRQALKAAQLLASTTDVAQMAQHLANSVLVGLPLPGHGNTSLRFVALMEIGAHDLALARIIEAHVDALAILSEAGDSVAAHTVGRMPLYGVWAARHPKTPLRAEPTSMGWQLNGSLPFCTGAREVDRALVVASINNEQVLFQLDSVEFPSCQNIVWHCAGMDRVPASTLTFSDYSIRTEQAIGLPGFYLQRRGFWCGAIGVAACWLGGAVGVLRKWRALAAQRSPDPHALAHLGASAAVIDAAAAHIHYAAALIDQSQLSAAELRVAAVAVRHVVEQACNDVINRMGRALGPGPMIFDASLAQQVADLSIYLRQSHAERDLEALGRCVLSPAQPESGEIWSWL